MNKTLFDNDSDSDGGRQDFGTNKDYAKTYNKFRSKELLKKLKDKDHKNDSDSDDSTESESSEDEVINTKFDEAFYKALASIKKKDPTIYDTNVRFFNEFDSGKSVDPDKKSQKAMTVKDYERDILLTKGGIYEEDEEEDNRPYSPTYNEEQNQIKNEFKKVIDDADSDDSNSEWGGIFKRREKTKEEERREDEQYAKWLAGEKAANIGENAKALKPLKDYWSNPKLAKSEAFLRDYVLNNAYTNRNKDEIPTYEDIVGNDAADEDDDVAMSEDEAELEKQAEFEHKFNFRYEEPDTEFIKRYPRTIEHSVRKEDNRRKEKRVEIKERKLKEKEQKMKDLEMLNALRKKEIEDKIEKLKSVTGTAEIEFNDEDLDGDFDPDEYDRKMQSIFNNEYYQIDEGEEKPDCPDIEDLKVEDWDNYDPEKDDTIDYDVGDEHCEDEYFNMDCDFDSAAQSRKSFQDELIENSRDRRKKRKRRSRFLEMLKREKPVFKPEDEKTYAEYLDEYYKLDYEDIIGDTPCRFKYVETVPNDFGLSVEEILLAKNKELNQWASLKKATQIRPEHVERNEVKMFQNKAKNDYLKRKILTSLFEESSADEEPTPAAAEADSKKKKNKNKKSETVVNSESQENLIVLDENSRKMELINSDEQSVVEKVKSKKKQIKTKELVANDVADNKTFVKEKAESPNKLKEMKILAKEIETKKIVKKDQKHKKQVESPQKPLIVVNNKKRKLSLSKNQNESDLKKKKINPGSNKSPSTTTAKKPIQNKIKNKLLNPNQKKQQFTTNKNKDPKAISDERLRAFGLNPRKYHNQQKYGNKNKKNPTETGSSKTPPGKKKAAAAAAAKKLTPIQKSTQQKTNKNKLKLLKFLNANKSG